MQKVIVTGSAGFIGFHLTKRLLNMGFEVVGLDNLNDYYSLNLKYARLAETGIYAPGETMFNGGENRHYEPLAFNQLVQSVSHKNYKFIRLNLEDKAGINELFASEQFDYVVHLAAQAGVRYSIDNPDAYIQSNIVGTFNILEACRHHPVKHLIYASSSSVYGDNATVPFSVDARVDSPVSLYAATKKSNELMAYTYSHLYNIRTTGLRFFTVYGSWGRPDMSPILFADAIISQAPLKVFNNGNMSRDFTHVSDIAEGIVRAMTAFSDEKPCYRLFNIGNGQPVNLLCFIETIEAALGSKAQKIMMPMQPGDVHQTWADTANLQAFTGFKPKTRLEDGIAEFVAWYKLFFDI